MICMICTPTLLVVAPNVALTPWAVACVPWMKNTIVSCISYPSLHAGYLVSVRRLVMDNIVLVKSSPVDPGNKPGESPTYISHEE